MKKIYQQLFGVSLIFVAFSFINEANAQECAIAPTCESLGYTKTEKDCAGVASLKCPFDTSKVYCTTYDDLDPLALGDIVYTDFSTSRPSRYQTNVSAGKTALGVVVNVEKRIAMGLFQDNPAINSDRMLSETEAAELISDIHEKILELCPTDVGTYNPNSFRSLSNGDKEVGKKLFKVTNRYSSNAFVDYYIPSNKDIQAPKAIIKQAFETIGISELPNLDSNTSDCGTITVPKEYVEEFIYNITGGKDVSFSRTDNFGWIHCRYGGSKPCLTSTFAPPVFDF